MPPVPPSHTAPDASGGARPGNASAGTHRTRRTLMLLGGVATVALVLGMAAGTAWLRQDTVRVPAINAVPGSSAPGSPLRWVLDGRTGLSGRIAGRVTATGLYLQARHAMAEKEYGKALTLLQEALLETPDEPILLRAAYYSALAENRVTDALVYAQGYLSARTRALQAEAAKAAPKPDEAEATDALADILNLPPPTAVSSAPLTSAVIFPSDTHDELAVSAQVMLALAAVRQGQWQEATQLLLAVPAPGTQALVIPVLRVWLTTARACASSGGQTGNQAHPRPLTAADLPGDFPEAGHYQNYQLALFNQACGHDAAAIALLKQAGADQPDAPYPMLALLYALWHHTGATAEAAALADTYQARQPLTDLPLPEAPPFAGQSAGDVTAGMAETLFSAASMLYQEGLDTQAEIYLKQALYLQPEQGNAAQLSRLLLGNVLENMERNSASLAMYRSIPEHHAAYVTAQVRRAIVKDRMGQSTAALKLLDTVARAHPHAAAAAHLARGDILRRQEKFEESSHAYSAALAAMDGQSRHWPIYYARGVTYERLGEWEKAEADFLHSLTLRPEQPDVMNYLAYSWLEQGRHLERAQKMLKKAVQMRPGDAHIIDSYGWALYKLGKYDQAVRYLELAVEMLPHDATTNDHLGDVYWRLGRRTEARYQWERALLFKPEDKVKAQVEHKLAHGLPPAEVPEATSSARRLLDAALHAIRPEGAAPGNASAPGEQPPGKAHPTPRDAGPTEATD